MAADLWPDAAPDRARANLRTAVWAVHQAWGPARSAPGDDPDGDRAGRGDVRSTSRRPDPRWNDDELLPGLDDDWAATARAEHRDVVVRQLAARAQTAEQEGDLADGGQVVAAGVPSVAATTKDAHRALLQRLLRAGDRADRGRRRPGVQRAAARRARRAPVAGDPRRPRPGATGRRAGAGRTAAVRPSHRDRGAGRSAGGRPPTAPGRSWCSSGEAGIGKTTPARPSWSAGSTLAGGRTAMAAGIDVAGETPFAAWLDLCPGLVAGVRAGAAPATWPVELNRLSAGLGARLGPSGIRRPPSTAPGAGAAARLRGRAAAGRVVLRRPADRDRDRRRPPGRPGEPAADRRTSADGSPGCRCCSCSPGATACAGPSSTRCWPTWPGSACPVTQVELAPISDRRSRRWPRRCTGSTTTRSTGWSRPPRATRCSRSRPTRTLVAGSDRVRRPTCGPPCGATAGPAARRDPATWSSCWPSAGRPLRPGAGPAGVAELDDAEDAAGAEGLLVRRDGRLGFRHELLREAVYAGSGDPAGLHDRLASALDPDEQVERGPPPGGRPGASPKRRRRLGGGRRARPGGGCAAKRRPTFLTARPPSRAPEDGALWLELEEVLRLVAPPARRWRPPGTDGAWCCCRLRSSPAAWCRRGRQFRTVICHPGGVAAGLPAPPRTCSTPTPTRRCAPRR